MAVIGKLTSILKEAQRAGREFIEELKNIEEEGEIGYCEIETRARADLVGHTATPDALTIKGLRLGDDKEPPFFVVTGIVKDEDEAGLGLRTESRVFVPTRPDVPDRGRMEAYNVAIPSAVLDKLSPNQPIFLDELFRKKEDEQDPPPNGNLLLSPPRRP